MGIESDQLVYDYLSRVGDVAQQQHLPSGDRMRLVSSLRNEIDRQRGKSGGDNPASVRRILGRLGSPDEVVQAASPGSDGDTGAGADSGGSADRGTGAGAGAASPRAPVAPEPPGPGVPAQRTRWMKGPREPKQPKLAKQPKAAKEPKAARGSNGSNGSLIPEQPSAPPSFPSLPAASPPHLAGMDELGPSTGSGGQPDWWRIEPGPLGMPTDTAMGARGFVGGVEIPAILEPPPEDDPDGPEDAKKAKGAAAEAVVEEAPKDGEKRRALWRRALARRSAAKEKAAPGGLANPFLLLAAALLVVGAAIGSWLALGGGWLLAYASRTLSVAESKWAVFGLPGVSAAGGLVWLWGRLDGRWGEAIPKDGMADALSGLWPVVLRTAAVTSALYLVWRARRRRAG